MTNLDRGELVAVGLALALALVAFGSVADAATDPETEQYIEDSAAWCEDRDGVFYQANVIGPHGGLHCRLPNGTTVHLRNVVDHGGDDA
jgi:hypothetical protein